MLRTARIRIGKSVRIGGLPAILVGIATIVASSLVGLSLLMLGIAALTSASQSHEPPQAAALTDGELALDASDYAAPVRGERPGLLP